MKALKTTSYPLLQLIIPLALTGLIQSGVWFFETIFLSHLSLEALAAGSLVSWAFGTVVVILYGTLSSINILVAHKYGAKDEKGIVLVVRDGFWLAILLAIPIIILFWNMSLVFLLFGQSPSIVSLSRTYLHAAAWGILPNVILIALLEVIMGLGRARLILVLNIISVSFTIFFSFCLIFGKLGLPMMGIAGAGWGMAISNWITVLLVGGYIVTNKQYKHYFSKIMTPAKTQYLMELLHIGAPMGLMYCVEIAFFFALTLIMGSFGSVYIAANQIALQYLGTLMAVIFSIAQAITVRMGHLLGAHERAAAEQSAYHGIFISMAFMMVVAIGYWFFSHQLISIDFDPNNPKNAEIVAVTQQFLKVSAIFQIFEAIRISLFGTLRALKDTRFTLFISILSFWGIALPIGYIIAIPLRYDGIGFWWGMVLAASFSVILLIWRFKRKITCFG